MSSNQYFIFFKTGTGGHLLSSLIYKMTVRDIDIPITHYGNMHNVTGFLVENISDTSTFITTEFKYLYPRYKLVHPLNENDPFIIPDHYSVDWEDLEKHYPNFNGIKITYNNDDIKNIVPLICLKLELECLGVETSKENGEFHTNDLLSNEFYKTPDEYNGKVHNIEFNKILTDQEFTLNFLSDITKKPITESMRLLYSNWVDATNLAIAVYNKLYGSVT